jgi:ATP-binding cassette, subfamily G (WHITE), member 2, SNQ2
MDEHAQSSLDPIHERSEDRDVPQVPGPQGGAKQLNAAVQNFINHHETSSPTLEKAHVTSSPTTQHHPPSSTRTPHTMMTRRRNSTASHVDIGHFDPEGVQELRRTMSRMSEQQLGDSLARRVSSHHTGVESVPHGQHRRGSDSGGSRGDTEPTLGGEPQEDAFDFQKTLKNYIRRYVHLSYVIAHILTGSL